MDGLFFYLLPDHLFESEERGRKDSLLKSYENAIGTGGFLNCRLFYIIVLIRKLIHEKWDGLLFYSIL